MAKKEASTAIAEQADVPVQDNNANENLALQTTTSATLTAASAQSLDDMFMEDAGAGLQNMGAGDVAIPFLVILQKGSPQVSRANAKYIKGAEQGMLMNTVTQQLFPGDVGVSFIPCGYNKAVVEWKTRDSGGGFVASHREGDAFLKTCTQHNEKGQLMSPTGNVLIDTAYHFGLLIVEGNPSWCVIAMASTQLKKSRVWNTTMKQILIPGPNGIKFNPPSYSHVYKLTTIGETRDNYDWFGFNIVVEKRVDDRNLYMLARDFSAQVSNNEVRVGAPPQVDVVEESPEKIPF